LRTLVQTVWIVILGPLIFFKRWMLVVNYVH
jgi:hypothetical protein